ncbi:hypothetical protein PABG_11829 [Paracoccidioides brasiliensis Pb03]|nr:hypothetical protein PABG_11829 [Paracoccidioides brasiliensis Pb03]
MELQANKHCYKPNFKIEDKVFLSLKNYRIQHPSRKLINMKIHPIFSSDKLWKTVNDPLPEQLNEALEPVKIQGENE